MKLRSETKQGLALVAIALFLVLIRNAFATLLFGTCRSVQACNWYDVFCKGTSAVVDTGCMASKAILTGIMLLAALIIFIVGVWRIFR